MSKLVVPKQESVEIDVDSDSKYVSIYQQPNDGNEEQIIVVHFNHVPALIQALKDAVSDNQESSKQV